MAENCPLVEIKIKDCMAMQLEKNITDGGMNEARIINSVKGTIPPYDRGTPCAHGNAKLQLPVIV
jgi:hypothetical protein